MPDYEDPDFWDVEWDDEEDDQNENLTEEEFEDLQNLISLLEEMGTEGLEMYLATHTVDSEDILLQVEADLAREEEERMAEEFDMDMFLSNLDEETIKELSSDDLLNLREYLESGKPFNYTVIKLDEESSNKLMDMIFYPYFPFTNFSRN